MKPASSDFWGERAKNVGGPYADPDSMKSIRLRIVLELLARHREGKLLDAGCGTGLTIAAFREAGWDASGVDASPGMVEQAATLLKEMGDPDGLVHQASITDLGLFPDGCFDAVVCIGVMYYIRDTGAAYREMNRVLKPGGILICSYHNELFDLFTFNKYTRWFFRRNIFPLLGGGDTERNQALDEALSMLIANPEAPAQHDPGSARDQVFTHPDNPLTIAETFAAHGLEMVDGPYYHGIHIIPPLMEMRFPELAAESLRMQYDLRRDWRSIFMAAHFLIEARKVA